MEWQTQAYYDSQKKTLRPGTYLRLHRNQWAVAEETFITPEMWDPCVNQAHHPTIISRDPLYVGIDVGIKHDNAARVAVKWDENGEKLILVSHRIWKPTPGKPLGLENTVEEDLRELNEQNDVVEIFADPYQMHRSITTLQAAGVPIKEYAQTQANCTLMGQTLFDLLTGAKSRSVRFRRTEAAGPLDRGRGESPWLENCQREGVKENRRHCRAGDGLCRCDAHRGEIGSRSARGFNRAMHVSREKIVPLQGAPVYIGQTLVEMPATVIAQSDRGSIRILAAFASEGMAFGVTLRPS